MIQLSAGQFLHRNKKKFSRTSFVLPADHFRTAVRAYFLFLIACITAFTAVTLRQVHDAIHKAVIFYRMMDPVRNPGAQCVDGLLTFFDLDAFF